MLEIYFSNKKRSGGRNVKGVEFDAKNNRAFVTFENYDGMTINILYYP